MGVVLSLQLLVAGCSYLQLTAASHARLVNDGFYRFRSTHRRRKLPLLRYFQDNKAEWEAGPHFNLSLSRQERRARERVSPFGF